MAAEAVRQPVEEFRCRGGVGRPTHLRVAGFGPAVADVLHGVGGERSEEHTSELQSLMRSSYAVFCLKKKKKSQHSSGDHKAANSRLMYTTSQVYCWTKKT